MRRKTWNGAAPSVSAACSCSIPISRRTGTTSRTTNGIETNIVASTIPGTANRIVRPWPASPPSQPPRP